MARDIDHLWVGIGVDDWEEGWWGREWGEVGKVWLLVVVVVLVVVGGLLMIIITTIIKIQPIIIKIVGLGIGWGQG